MEGIWGYGASAAALPRRVRMVNPEVVERSRAENRSAILLAGHLCNWEWLLLAAGAHLAIPIDVVYKPLRLAASTPMSATRGAASARTRSRTTAFSTN